MADFWVNGIVAVRDGNPYIQLSNEKGMIAQLSMSETRQIAMDMLVMAARTEADAMIYKFFAKEDQTLLADGGTMVIEDVPSCECAEDLLALLPDSARIVDRRHIKERYDELLVIYEKPADDAMI